MTTRSKVASPVLPVSILTGSSTRALLKDIVAEDPGCRFGLLASHGSEAIAEGLVVEKLVAATEHGGYDPGQISAQIAAFAENAAVDHLIIECDSKTHPIAFASLFLPQNEAPGLSEFARLSSIVLALESEALLGSLIPGRRNPGFTSPCVLADQIEVASLVVLRDNATGDDLALARSIVSAINPRTRVIAPSSETPLTKFLDASLSFDFAAATEGAGWRKVVEDESGPISYEHKVSTFAYRARRPFHPEKFWQLLQSPFPGVVRAKGYFWLATRMKLVGGLNVAGSERHHSPAGEWWSAIAHADASGRIEIPDRFKKVWAEPFGDRRQAIAFLGIDMNATDLSAQLDACLLNDFEMAAGENSWALLPDPFPAWSGHTHDHECDDHDCCHH